MVAYNLLLSVFPLALLALFIAGRVLESGDLEQSVLAGPAAAVPDGHRRHAHQRARPGARLVDRLRRGGAGRQHLDRLVVLGRARHGLLPDLPRALPQLAASRSASRWRCSWWCCCSWRRPWPCRRSRACCVSSADDLPLGLSEVDGADLRASRSPPGLLLLFADPLPDLLDGAQPARCPGGRSGRGRSAATVAIGDRRLRVPGLPVVSINTIARFGTTFVFVRDRADLVLRAGDHHPRRRDRSTPCGSRSTTPAS